MELQKVLELRQSIRRYKDGDVPETHLREMVQAAGMAPSAKNMQNWHFVAIKSREVMRDLADLIATKNEDLATQVAAVDEKKAERFRKLCKNFTLFWKETAPALILVFSEDYLPDGYEQYALIGGSQEILDDLKLRKNSGMQSVGCAIENFSLKAVDLGYGTTILTSANYVSAEIEDYLKEKGYFEKEGYYLVCMLSVGIPQENQKSPSKKGLDEIYTFVE